MSTWIEIVYTIDFMIIKSFRGYCKKSDTFFKLNFLHDDLIDAGFLIIFL